MHLVARGVEPENGAVVGRSAPRRIFAERGRGTRPGRPPVSPLAPGADSAESQV